MCRHQIGALEQWLAAPRRKPMVIRGARQVGKSTLVRLFCEAAGRELVAVDLERRFDANPPSLQTVAAGVPQGRRGSGGDRARYRLLSLPLYLVERLPGMLQAVGRIGS